MNWRRPLLLSAAVLIVTPEMTAPLDLDVGVPPGSPTSWGRRFPSITPRGGPLFPITPRGGSQTGGKTSGGKTSGAKSDRRTVVQPATIQMDVNISTSFGVVRILTWDLAGHLTWVARTPRSLRGPVTGPGAGGKTVALPYVNDGLYWANMASLLRLMLHPQIVSEKELIAHLVEIGEPLLAVLDNSVSEKSLVPPSTKVRKMVEAPVGGARPLPGVTPRETMLKRFLAEELVDVYPYDPEGGFGQRFFLYSEEVEPYLIEYARKHAGSFLRRNAVSAVARFKTDASMSALGEIAATTRDPVVLMRSLAALGAYRSLRNRGPILSRMMEVKDPIEKIAFVAAAGRMGMREAVPYLLKLGGRSKDPDMLQAVVAALVRIPHAPGEKSVSKFAKRIAKLAGTRPERYRIDARNGPRADIPDGPKVRGTVIHQLALCLQVHLAGSGKDAAGKQLLALVNGSGGARRPGARPGRPGGRAGPAGRRMPRRSRGFANNSMRDVLPPVQLIFLETLKKLGAEGIAGLETIARDVSVEPALRGHALSQLPWTSRGNIAARILGGRASSIESKIYAIEVLANDGHDQLEALGRKLLEACAKAGRRTSSPEDRYLWLQALRALGKRNLLKIEDLLDLMAHPKARKLTNEALQQRLRNQIEALVEDVARGLGAKAISRRISRRIDEIITQVIATGLNKNITEAKRKEHRRHVLERLAGLKGHKADRRYKSMMAQELVRYLLGFRMGIGLKARATFKPVVLLEEEILLALGRTRTKEAAKALVAFLADRPDSPLRAHAALAIGLLRKLGHARHLVPLLKDPDGFTRFCAYESLRHLTGKDIFADWMYGDEAARNVAAEQYRKLVGK